MKYQSLFSGKNKKNISRYCLLNKQNSAIIIMCYYQHGVSYHESEARCLGASFIWDEVVLHPYNLNSFFIAYMISHLLHRTRSHPNTIPPTIRRQLKKCHCRDVLYKYKCMIKMSVYLDFNRLQRVIKVLHGMNKQSRIVCATAGEL